MRDGQEGAAQRVEVGGRWACRRGRRPCAAASLLLRAQRAADALRVPGLPGSRAASGEVARQRSRRCRGRSRIAGLAIAAHGVVDVLGRLLPGVEHHLLVGVVGVQRGDDALDRVVEQHRADADLHVELEAVRVG